MAAPLRRRGSARTRARCARDLVSLAGLSRSVTRGASGLPAPSIAVPIARSVPQIAVLANEGPTNASGDYNMSDGAGIVIGGNLVVH